MSSKIHEYLLPGRSIEMESDEQSKPLRTLIESDVVDGQFRVLAPIHEGRTFIFSGSDTVNVIFSYQDAGVFKVAQIRCRIVKKGIIEGLPVLTLEILGDPVPTQRRRAFRVNVLSRLIGQVEQDRILDLTSKDISVYGMFLYSAVRIERGKLLRVLWNYEGSEERLDDPEFLKRAFSNDEESEAHVQTGPAVPKTSAELKKEQELKEEKKTYFIIDAHVVSCDFDKEIGKYAIRVNYDHIGEHYTSRILKFLYKKQAEIIGNDPNVANRIDKFFAREGAAEPLPLHIALITLGALFFSLLAIVFFLLAKPAGSTFMDSFFNIARANNLKTFELSLSLGFSIFSMVLESLSLALRVRLAMQKTYRLNVVDGVRLLLFIMIAFYIISFYVGNAG